MDAGTAPAPAPAPAPAAAPAPSDPAAPTAGAAPIPPSVSRYRSLRGKSVSSPRARPAFDVFEDGRGGGGDEANGDADSPSRRRHRSKSATAAKGPGGSGGRAAERRAAGGGFPTSVASALSPRPVNLLLGANKGANKGGSGKKSAPRDDDRDVAARAWADLKPPPSLPIDTARLPTPDKRAADIAGTGADPAAGGTRPRPDAVPPTPVSAPATPIGTAPKSPVTTSPAQPAGDEDQPPPPPQRQDEPEEPWADEVARLDAETDRILAEQKKLDLARLQAQLVATPPKPKSPILDKLSFFSRSARKGAGQPRSQPATPTTLFSFDLSSRGDSPGPSPPPDKMSLIEQGGRGIVPQTDAPASAVNGGERRVTVRCLSSTFNLPVTPDTSPLDIVYSSANLTTHNVDPDTSIVVECFVVLGLERRLRRYERVRDVMNSWDRDAQNSLLILPYSSRQDDQDLDAASVPRSPEPPNGFSMQLYHSARPGKWAKRWVTLQEGGQVFASKKPDAKPADRDSAALCHLSDFDIYTPKDSEVRRHLRPPKKFCYAIKSQQKTTVFPNGENYVHFFCTDDSRLAQRFHDLVHGWRSWYLLNKQVDLARKEKPAEVPKHPLERDAKSKGAGSGVGHKLRVSVDEKPYTIGALQPLINMDRFDKPIEEFGKASEEDKTAASPTAAHDAPKPPRTLRRSHTQPASLPQTPLSDPEFSAGGLLGDAYDKRKLQADNAGRDPPKAADGPFTQGPSLLNGGGAPSPASPASPNPEPKPWIPSATEHSARMRSQSTRSARRPATADAAQSSARREKPPPLVDAIPAQQTPAHQPPARRRDALGHGVKPPPGAPLINFASGGAASPGGMSPASPRGVPPRSGSTRVPPPSLSSSSAPAAGGGGGGRQRSRSTASSPGGGSGGRRVPPESQPPVPPLPSHPARRGGDAARGREGRPPEPLVNRAR